MALLLTAGCSGEEKKEARPSGKKASVTAKPSTTSKPAAKKVEAKAVDIKSKPVNVKAKTGGGMCCCKGAGFVSMVESASCARDLGGSCIANSSCPK